MKLVIEAREKAKDDEYGEIEEAQAAFLQWFDCDDLEEAKKQIESLSKRYDRAAEMHDQARESLTIERSESAVKDKQIAELRDALEHALGCNGMIRASNMNEAYAHGGFVYNCPQCEAGRELLKEGR